MIEKIKAWFRSLFEPKINYKKLYEEEVVKRQDVEQCLNKFRAQIRACVHESICNKDYDGEGL